MSLAMTREEREAFLADHHVRIRPERWLTVDYTKRFQAP